MDQGKTIMKHAVAGGWARSDPGWQQIPCDMMHQQLPANCVTTPSNPVLIAWSAGDILTDCLWLQDENVDPGLPPGYIPQCRGSDGKTFECKNITRAPGGSVQHYFDMGSDLVFAK